jgi:hypothetical protein
LFSISAIVSIFGDGIAGGIGAGGTGVGESAFGVVAVEVSFFGASVLGASGVSTFFDSPFLGMVAVFGLPINVCRCPADLFWHLARRLNLML